MEQFPKVKDILFNIWQTSPEAVMSRTDLIDAMGNTVRIEFVPPSGMGKTWGYIVWLKHGENEAYYQQGLSWAECCATLCTLGVGTLAK